MNKREYLLPDIDQALCDFAAHGIERQVSFPITITYRASMRRFIMEIPMSDPTPFLHNRDPDIIIDVDDEPGHGGAHHAYDISVMGQPERTYDADGTPRISRKPVVHTAIRFQKGGKVESGPNGVTNESLLEIVRHRLACFQAGPFPSKETASALAHIEDAIMWLGRRTAKRTRRGVEGKSVL